MSEYTAARSRTRAKIERAFWELYLEVRTTGLAGGLLSPYKGLLPACAWKAH